ncbi:MAG: aquaporin, partial [Bryobacteraceae bacterium]|nr:aquaporin [Bryobacteraceae bacterium]
MRSSLAAEMLAEFLGTMVILLFGAGVCAMVALFGSGAPGEIVHGGYTSITIGWALGVLFGVIVSIRISGAHLNPAVTLACAVFRGFAWRKVLPYVLAQTLGAMAGAALVWFNYREA